MTDFMGYTKEYFMYLLNVASPKGLSFRHWNVGNNVRAKKHKKRVYILRFREGSVWFGVMNSFPSQFLFLLASSKLPMHGIESNFVNVDRLGPQNKTFPSPFLKICFHSFQTCRSEI